MTSARLFDDLLQLLVVDPIGRPLWVRYVYSLGKMLGELHICALLVSAAMPCSVGEGGSCQLALHSSLRQ